MNAFDRFPRSARPLFNDATDGYADQQKRKIGLRQFYQHTSSWLNALPADEKRKAQFAVQNLLAARNGQADYLLKLLAIFRFLEWADGARTLNWQPVAGYLDVSRTEAEAVVKLRNDITHARVEPHEAIEKVSKVLVMKGYSQAKTEGPWAAEAMVMEYLLTHAERGFRRSTLGLA